MTPQRLTERIDEQIENNLSIANSMYDDAEQLESIARHQARRNPTAAGECRLQSSALRERAREIIANVLTTEIAHDHHQRGESEGTGSRVSLLV